MSTPARGECQELLLEHWEIPVGYPNLREAAAAHRYIHDRKNIGKVLPIP
jgi:hypothetical protein